MAELGNRFAPIFHLVDMSFEKESGLISTPIAQSMIIRCQIHSGLWIIELFTLASLSDPYLYK